MIFNIFQILALRAKQIMNIRAITIEFIIDFGFGIHSLLPIGDLVGPRWPALPFGFPLGRVGPC